MLTTTHAPDVLILMALGLLATGVIAGLLAGLLGVGGGIVIVPVLFLLFTYLEVPSGIVMHMVVATSLATIIPISLSSAREHYRRAAVDMDVFRHWAPFMLVAAGIAAGLSGRLDSSYLQLLFGGIAIYVAATMIRGKTSAADAAPEGSTITPLGRGATGVDVPNLSMFAKVGNVNIISQIIITMLAKFCQFSAVLAPIFAIK